MFFYFLDCISCSKFEEMKIENLTSLQRINGNFTLVERISFKNLFALRDLNINLKLSDNSDITEMLIKHSPNIQSLSLGGFLSNFNLDKLIHLKKLQLGGKLMEDFDFDIFKNISNQLTDLTINIDNKTLNKMFNGYHFSNLSSFSISSNIVTRLDKKMFEAFPILKYLTISVKKLQIDCETFSSLKQLTELTISYNSISSLEDNYFSNLTNLVFLNLERNDIKVIQENTFSNLKKLQTLNLSFNQIENLSPQSFFGLRKLKYLNLKSNKLRNFDMSILENFDQIEEIDLSENPIINKEEILTRFNDTKIKLKA